MAQGADRRSRRSASAARGIPGPGTVLGRGAVAEVGASVEGVSLGVGVVDQGLGKQVGSLQILFPPPTFRPPAISFKEVAATTDLKCSTAVQRLRVFQIDVLIVVEFTSTANAQRQAAAVPGATVQITGRASAEAPGHNFEGALTKGPGSMSQRLGCRDPYRTSLILTATMHYQPMLRFPTLILIFLILQT